MSLPNDPGDDPERFWDAQYRKKSPRSSGNPSTALATHAAPLSPGRALELGCARGDDAVWLATHGWRVTAVDIAPTALTYASENATRAGVADRITFEQHDLARTFPKGQFDLVTALFLYSPVAFARDAVLRRAADAVCLGGTLLIAGHGSRTPWSWAAPGTNYPTPEEALSSLALPPRQWKEVFVGAVERTATGPDGQTAQARDLVLALQKRAE